MGPPLQPPPCFSRQHLSLVWKSPSKLGWPVRRPHGPPVSTSSEMILQLILHPDSFEDSGDQTWESPYSQRKHFMDWTISPVHVCQIFDSSRKIKELSASETEGPTAPRRWQLRGAQMTGWLHWTRILAFQLTSCHLGEVIPPLWASVSFMVKDKVSRIVLLQHSPTSTQALACECSWFIPTFTYSLSGITLYFVNGPLI